MSFLLVKKYLEVLNLSNVTLIETNNLKKQYLSLAKQYHPDLSDLRYKDGTRFVQLKEAYDYLIDNMDAVNDYFFSITNVSKAYNLYDIYLLFSELYNWGDDIEVILELYNRIEKLDSLFKINKSAKLVFDILQVYSFFQKDDNYDVKVLIRCICKIALKSLKNLANTMVNLEKIVNTIKSQNEKSLDFSSFSDDEKLLYSLYVTYSNFQTLLNDNQPDIDKAFMDIVRLSLFSGYKESIPNESEMRFAFRKHKHFLKKETVESKLNNIKTEFNENIKLGSLSYLYKKVIIFDLETSGLNPLIDNIIEVAMIILTTDKNGNVIKKEIIDELVKLPQGKRISDKIIELTGITNEDLAKDGKDSVSVINNLCSMMLETEKIAMFAYNASFDLNFLYNFFKLQNLEYLLNLSNIDYYDCLTIYKDYAEYPHKLKDAINHFNLQDKVQNTHRAIDDANSTLEIIKSMVSINDNLTNYVNLFGYNPKYPINMHPIIKIKFLPQPYNSRKRLYEK